MKILSSSAFQFLNKWKGGVGGRGTLAAEADFSLRARLANHPATPAAQALS